MREKFDCWGDSRQTVMSLPFCCCFCIWSRLMLLSCLFLVLEMEWRWWWLVEKRLGRKQFLFLSIFPTQPHFRLRFPCFPFSYLTCFSSFPLMLFSRLSVSLCSPYDDDDDDDIYSFHLYISFWYTFYSDLSDFNAFLPLSADFYHFFRNMRLSPVVWFSYLCFLYNLFFASSQEHRILVFLLS